jgi:peptidoglycan/xylan/chitin deacetylase (PgdA/CDA1 family)
LIVLLALPTVAPGFRVRVGGHTVTLHDRAPTVALALTRAGFVAHDGPLVAVMSGRALDRHFDRARVRVDGKVRPLAARVANGDSLQLLNGHPVVETTVHRESRIPGGGLPEIEYELWQPPVAGATDQLVGAASGEIVSEVPVRAPVNATPVTDASVALSFDDGPNPQWTPAILAILRDANIKATFCVVGYAAERYPALVRQIAAEGHTLCNHTVHHVQMLGRKSAPEIDAELRGNSDIIEKAAGVRPLFFRAPGGTWAQNLVDAVHSQGMRALGWNVDPADYRRPGAAVISATILHHVRPGAVVLMHDGGGDRSQTVGQLRALIEHLRAMGYSFRVPTA